MQLRVIWVLIVVLLFSQLIYWLIDRGDTGKNVVDTLDRIDEVLDIQNHTDEKIRIQDDKLIYQGYKLDSLKISYAAFLVKYNQKMDSLDLALEQMQFAMDRMNERLTQKDKQLEEGIENITDLFETYKRKTNRDLRQIKNDIKSAFEQVAELQFFDKRVPDKYLLDEEEVLEQEQSAN
ncbi:MAG: hypothetical protein CMG00_05150 [Candidatus Marinimicrobia bacterium]|nr:hypothetical protein [Candidatus Neomarinimicrobiota bacterium]|tara:strand:- start:1191 stop:1727 length:537 start_codon:yes stop_codon:yes gene_type:complete